MPPLRISPEAQHLAEQIVSDFIDLSAFSFPQTDWWRGKARPSQLPPPLEDDWFILMFCAGRGFGKALALNTPIPTLHGWTTMGDLQVGDTLFDENGCQTTVTWVSPIQFGRECYKVTFSDGAAIVADADHEWLTTNRKARKELRRSLNPCHSPSVVTTREIANKVYDGKEANHAVTVCGVLDCPPVELPIDPYVLGAWLGDGSSSSAEITNAKCDYEIISNIESHYHIKRRNGIKPTPLYGIGALRTNSKIRFSTQIKALGVFKNKHVPDVYKRASAHQRLSLLQGLMDTDGHISLKGNCEFCSVSQRLAHDVFELCLSLGMKPVCNVGKATLNGRYICDKYRVTFTPYIPVFRLERKRALIKPRGAQSERQFRRYITAVEQVPSVAVRCIKVNSQSSLFLAGREMIPTHNSRSESEIAIELARTRPGSIGTVVGRTTGDARDIMVLGDSGILATAVDGFRPVYKPSQRRLIFPNGTEVVILGADEPENFRGHQANWAVVDELAAWRRMVASWDMLTMGVRLPPNPHIIIGTTPKPFPLIKRLRDDPKNIVRVGNTYENIANLSPAFIEQVIKPKEGTTLGRQEIHAEILSDVKEALWRRAVIEELRVSEAPAVLTRIVVAVDPAASSSDESAETGIIVVGQTFDKHYWVLADETIRGAPPEWARKVVEVYDAFEADVIVAERNNGGEMVASTIRNVRENAPVETVFASRGKTARAEPISVLYAEGRVHHVGYHGELEDQMCTWVQDGKSKSPDRLDALVWGLSKLSGLVSGKAPNTGIAFWDGTL